MIQLDLELLLQPWLQFFDGQQPLDLLLMFMIDVVVSGVDIGDVGLSEEDVAGTALSDGLLKHALDLYLDGIVGEVFKTTVVDVPHNGQKGLHLAVVYLILLQEVRPQPFSLYFPGETSVQSLDDFLLALRVDNRRMDGLNLLFLDEIVSVGLAKLSFIVSKVEVADGGAHNLTHGEVAVKLVQVIHFGDESRRATEVPVYELLELPQISEDVLFIPPHPQPLVHHKHLRLHDHPQTPAVHIVNRGDGRQRLPLGDFLHQKKLMLSGSERLEPALLEKRNSDATTVASVGLIDLEDELMMLYLQQACFIESPSLTAADD